MIKKISNDHQGIAQVVQRNSHEKSLNSTTLKPEDNSNVITSEERLAKTVKAKIYHLSLAVTLKSAVRIGDNAATEAAIAGVSANDLKTLIITSTLEAHVQSDADLRFLPQSQSPFSKETNST